MYFTIVVHATVCAVSERGCPPLEVGEGLQVRYTNHRSTCRGELARQDTAKHMMVSFLMVLMFPMSPTSHLCPHVTIHILVFHMSPTTSWVPHVTHLILVSPMAPT